LRTRRYPGQGLAADRGQLGDPSPPVLSGLQLPLHHLRAGADPRVDRGEKGRAAHPFDRDKLARSIQVAVRKRAVDPDRIERLVTSIQRRLESSGDTEIASDAIGEMVMESLLALDPVAYIRFASVYKNFREVSDFEELVGKIGEQDHPFGN
jgi:hypothetical protein